MEEGSKESYYEKMGKSRGKYASEKSRTIRGEFKKDSGCGHGLEMRVLRVLNNKRDRNRG